MLVNRDFVFLLLIELCELSVNLLVCISCTICKLIKSLNGKYRNTLLVMKKWLSYILVSLIVLQSVAAFADDHQVHQSGAQHIEDEHEYAVGLIDAIKALPETDQKTSDNQHDCQHCCHCHGLAQFILNSGNNITIYQSGDQFTEFNSVYPTRALSPGFRPPIV